MNMMRSLPSESFTSRVGILAIVLSFKKIGRDVFVTPQVGGEG